MSDAKDPLFQSAPGMADAVNYANWTYSLFAPFVRGEVLEVGCGVGTFTSLLAAAPEVRRLLSIDISAPAVEAARRRVPQSSVEVRCADVMSVSGAFDLVVCMNVLEHIEDDRAALQHMLGLVRPGGTLFLLVPAHAWLYSPFDVESGHYRRYTKRSLSALMASIGDPGIGSVRQFYFNMVGALGYFLVYRVLRKAPREDASSEIGWFDRLVVPVQRRLEGRRAIFGISVVTIATRSGGGR